MHRLAAIVAVLCASPVLAQEGEAASPPPEAAPAPRVRQNPDLEKPEVMAAAKAFFSALVLGDARQTSNLSSSPFQLEDRRLGSEDELLQAWQKALRQKRTDLLTLYGVEVLTAAEMEQKYGKPPARLANFPWKRAGAYVAVANLSGHAAVAVFARRSNGEWTAVGYHD